MNIYATCFLFETGFFDCGWVSFRKEFFNRLYVFFNVLVSIHYNLRCYGCTIIILNYLLTTPLWKVSSETYDYHIPVFGEAEVFLSSLQANNMQIILYIINRPLIFSTCLAANSPMCTAG